jgi:Flp pilus assembly protein CpaB
LKRSNRLVLLIGVFLAVVAFVAIALLLNQGPPPSSTNTPPTTLPTVVAVTEIPLGTTVTPDMVTTQELKVEERKEGAFQATGLVVGEVARRKIIAGAQLTTSDFATSGTACGTIDVPPTLRAMSVMVDQVSGVGTIINAGDFTDAVIGFTGDKFPVVTVDPKDDTITVVQGLNGTTVKMLIEGMQVLCRQLPPPPAAAQGQAAQPTTAPSGEQQTSLTGQQEIVILAVTPTQAEILKFAQLDGSITLVLRSAADFHDPVTGAIIPAVPSGSEGITLKKLTTDFAVPIPELVEAILPAQAKP